MLILALNLKTNDMNAIIETHVKNDDIGTFNEFNLILSAIEEAQNESQLRNFMYNTLLLERFDFGFGSNHMWVKEKINSIRILFIEF